MRRVAGLLLLSVLFLAEAQHAAGADVISVAAASNFRAPAEAIAAQFTEDTGHRVRISSASTGTLYAQITNGAPFDVLLAADAKRPRLLAESGLGVADTRMTYATGVLVLWSAAAGLAGDDCRIALAGLDRGHLAIANPQTAPYGLAARQYLVAEGLWNQLLPRLVYGENVAQALHFVATGNATLGLIAKSQALDPRLPKATCSWTVPAGLHGPIDQQAILLRRAAGVAGAERFIEYLGGDAAQGIIMRFGYRVGE